MDSTDWNCLQRFARTRDEEAFALLVQRHGSLVLGVCRRRLRDAHYAEDACQAAFLVLARRAGELQAHESLTNWLFGVALRTSAHLCAREAEQRRREAAAAQGRQEIHMQAANPEAQRQLEDVLDEALARLPAGLREPLLLLVLEGKSYDEAAAELNVSADTIRGRIARARERLRRQLALRGLALPQTLTAVVLESVSREALTAGAARQIAARAAQWTGLETAGAGVTANALQAAQHVVSGMQASALAGWTAAAAALLVALGGIVFLLYPVGNSSRPLTAAVARLQTSAARPAASQIPAEKPAPPKAAEDDAAPAAEFGEGIENLLQVLPVDLKELDPPAAAQKLSALYNVNIRLSDAARIRVGARKIDLKHTDRNGLEVLNALTAATDLQLRIRNGAIVLCLLNEAEPQPDEPPVQAAAEF